MRLFGQRASRGFAAVALIGVFVGSGSAVVLANSAPEAGAAPAIPCPTPVMSGPTATVTCPYNGSTGADGTDEFWTVPAGVTQATFTAYGAAGVDTHGTPVGFGGVTTATLAVTPGLVLTVVAGGQGVSGSAGGAGGFGGGGAGNAPNGGGGGGASSVSDGTNTLIVAGGGGGTGADDPLSGSNPSTAGQGGGINGFDGAGNGFDGAGSFNGSTSQANGTGGTQAGPGMGAGVLPGSPGSLGQGGAGADNGGGGGGGYYGGGGGGSGVVEVTPFGDFPLDPGAQGGGGSGFIVSSAITGNLPTSGNSQGDGSVVITYTDDDLTISPPSAPVTANATSPSGAKVSFAPTVSDPDDTTPPAATCSPSSGSIFPIGQTMVTCSASDPDDLSSPVSVSFTVTVLDDDLTLSQPANITTSATGPDEAVVNYPLPTASDPDDTTALPAPNCSPSPGSTFAVGTTTVTCTVDEGAAVTAAQTQLDTDSSILNDALTGLNDDAGVLASDVGDLDPTLANDASTLAADTSAAPPNVTTIDDDVANVDSALTSLEAIEGSSAISQIVSDVDAVDAVTSFLDTAETVVTNDEAALAAAQAADNDTPSSVSVSFTVTVFVPPGGAVTVGKTTSLIGNYPDKVSGSGWTADSSVTLNECASTTYSPSTCDTANQATVAVGTGTLTGIFKNDPITLQVGTIDTNGDTCGIAGASATCYIVVVGNTGDVTASGPLSFKLPTFAVAKTTKLLGNYVDRLKASGFPIGDTIDAQECDGSVSAPSNVSTNCDDTTQITGTSGPSGVVVFSTGVTMKVNDAYSEAASNSGGAHMGGGAGRGRCDVGGTCAIAVTDSDNAAIGLSTSVGFASPVMLLKKTTGVLGHYVDSVKAGGFPAGDTVVAQECNSSVVIPTSVGTDCDTVNEVTGIAGANGKVVFNAPGITMAVGGAYSDASNGACSAGGSCEIVVSDSANPSVGVDEAASFAAPTGTVAATADVQPNALDKVTAASFPVGDTVTAQECDSAVTPANVATNCDSATTITGTAGPSGKVTFNAVGVTVLVGSAYSNGGGTSGGAHAGGAGGTGGAVVAGGTCDIIINDSTNSGFFIAVPVGLAG